MDKKTDSTYLRLPSKLKLLIQIYARQKGLTFNQSIIHLLSKGLHLEKCFDDFHIEHYTENFFESVVRNGENSEQD